MDSLFHDMKAARFWLTGLLVVGIGFAIVKASSMIIIIIASIVFSIFVESIGDVIQKYLRLPRSLSIVLVFILALVLFGLLIASAIPVFVNELSSLKPFIPDGDSFDNILKALNLGADSSGTTTESFLTFSPELLNQVSTGVQGVTQPVISAVSSAFGGLANIVLLTMMSLYLALEDRAIERFLYAIAPKQSEGYIVSIWTRVRSKTESWFKGQVVVGITVGILTYVGLLIIKVKYAFLLASLAAILGMIPFGIVVAFLPALAISLSKGSVLAPVYVTILYGGIQYFTDYILQPLVVRKVTGIPPLLAIVAAVVCVTLFGFLGFFIAIPSAIFLLEAVRDFERHKGDHHAQKDTAQDDDITRVVALQE